MELFQSPREYFSQAVRGALESRGIETFPRVESYLVELLEHYLDARNLFEPEHDETGQPRPKTLAELYLIAANSEPVIRVELLKKLGDRSLYISGFFGDSLERKLVDLDYYAEMGGAAYRELSAAIREDALARVYQVFSRHFIDYVDVLTLISQNSMVQNNQSLLRLYDRYLRTGSDLAREKLIEMGVLNLPTPGTKAPQFKG